MEILATPLLAGLLIAAPIAPQPATHVEPVFQPSILTSAIQRIDIPARPWERSRSARSTPQAQAPQRRQASWIARHPILFGSLVGFAGGFLIGYAAGDDGVFYDFTAEFNGCVLGGIGAGAGAFVGWALTRD
jgi:hypothetical protein